MRRSIPLIPFILFISFILFIKTTSAQKLNSDLYLQTSELAHLMINYEADRNSINRFYSSSGSRAEWWTQQRRDDYNSPQRRRRLLENISAYKKQLTAIDFDKISINGKVDYLLFKRDIEDEEYQLAEEDKLYNTIVQWLPFSDRIYNLIEPRKRGITANGEAIAKELNEINKILEIEIKKLKKADSLDKAQADLGTAAVRGLMGSLKDYYSFYNGYDPLFTWWVPKTYAETDSLLGLYAGTFRSKIRLTVSQKDDGSGIIGRPIGNEELIRQLKLEYLPYSPDELVDIANKEFAWCDAELLKASNEMGYGNDWKAAQEKVKNSYVAPGKQPEAMYELYKQSGEFLKKHDLVTIPPLAEEDWSMYMMSPERQRISPFFLGGESLIISYPTNTMSYEDKMMSMRGNNPDFSRATVHHELIAGHHLQGYMQDRYKTYRNFGTPFWIEGNALYWEMLLWDMKFPKTPGEKIGMLFWRMHRCARIIFSLNYHLGKWTPQQCIDFLVDRVGHERANAEGEVRRSFTGGYGPLYQIAYMIGGLQFMALKRELVDNKKMSLRQFHDAILHENNLPVEMLRAILINQDIKRDHKTSWRFYSPN